MDYSFDKNKTRYLFVYQNLLRLFELEGYENVNHENQVYYYETLDIIINSFEYFHKGETPMFYDNHSMELVLTEDTKENISDIREKVDSIIDEFPDIFEKIGQLYNELNITHKNEALDDTSYANEMYSIKMDIIREISKLL